MRPRSLAPVLFLAVLTGLAACGGPEPSSLDLLTPAPGPTTDPTADAQPELEEDGTFEPSWTPVPPPFVDPAVTVTARDGTVRSGYDGTLRVSSAGGTTGPC